MDNPMPVEERPDKCKAVITTDRQGFVFHVDPAFQRSKPWRDYQSRMGKMVVKLLGAGLRVNVVCGTFSEDVALPPRRR